MVKKAVTVSLPNTKKKTRKWVYFVNQKSQFKMQN